MGERGIAPIAAGAAIGGSVVTGWFTRSTGIRPGRPRVCLAPGTPGLAVVPLSPPRPARHIGIATARQRHGHPLVRTMVEWLRKEAEALTGREPRDGDADL